MYLEGGWVRWEEVEIERWEDDGILPKFLNVMKNDAVAVVKNWPKRTNFSS